MADDDPTYLLSDRDLLVAVFNAIGALATRLTGERLSVSMPHPGGGYIQVDSSLAAACFEPNTAAPATEADDKSQPFAARRPLHSPR
jgi:hypothetical protein